MSELKVVPLPSTTLDQNVVYVNKKSPYVGAYILCNDMVYMAKVHPIVRLNEIAFSRSQRKSTRLSNGETVDGIVLVYPSQLCNASRVNVSLKPLSDSSIDNGDEVIRLLMHSVYVLCSGMECMVMYKGQPIAVNVETIFSSRTPVGPMYVHCATIAKETLVDYNILKDDE
jgi:hypothetical protein